MQRYKWGSQVNGYVYIIDAKNGVYKIGMSKNPMYRIKSLGVRLPYDFETVCLIGTNKYITLETELHDIFIDKRLEGEWFTLSDGDIEWLIADAGAMGNDIFVSDNWTKYNPNIKLAYEKEKVSFHEV